MSYLYCDTHKVGWDSERRDYCLECMEQLEREERPLTDDELMEAGYPPRHCGNDDRVDDCHSV